MPRLLEQAVQRRATPGPGVAVLTLPGDVGGLDLPKDSRPAAFVAAAGAAGPRRTPSLDAGGRAARTRPTR